MIAGLDIRSVRDAKRINMGKFKNYISLIDEEGKTVKIHKVLFNAIWLYVFLLGFVCGIIVNSI